MGTGSGEWENGTERDGAGEDHDGDNHADAGVGIEASFVRRLPDHGRCDDDSNVVERVADHVNHDTRHAEVGVAMASLADVDFVAVAFVCKCGLYESARPAHGDVQSGAQGSYIEAVFFCCWWVRGWTVIMFCGQWSQYQLALAR